jgi:ABC-type glutathione transport system ATPase component
VRFPISTRRCTDGSLGGSGSGKTTLLNAVAHRLGGLPVEDGEVAYYASNGESDRVKLGRGEVKRRLGFVRQQDFLVECLTGESLSKYQYVVANDQYAKLLPMYVTNKPIQPAEANDPGRQTASSGQSIE